MTDQPDPLPASGDVWAEIIDGETDQRLLALYAERRAVGIARYGVPLQRDNGRDAIRDLREEVLDGMAYAASARRYDVVEALRAILVGIG